LTWIRSSRTSKNVWSIDQEVINDEVVPEEFDISILRQQMAAAIVNARQHVENYRALAQMTPIEMFKPAPRVWFGFIMLVRRPLPDVL
jgi:hypothetical protein